MTVFYFCKDQFTYTIKIVTYKIIYVKIVIKLRFATIKTFKNKIYLIVAHWA